MYKLRFIAILLFMGLAAQSSARGNGEPAGAAAQTNPSQQAWQREFEDICSRTQDAMTFSQDELTALIQRCDALREQVQKLDDTQKKVYLGRLRMCRGLYAYVLESKRNEKK
jgi:Skp family chaperone for outer membrane proteins